MTQDELKLVLEALKWCHGGEPCGTAEAIAVIEKALAQPKQKPMAWKLPDKNVVFWEDTKEVDEYHGFEPTIPLYPHPQRSESSGKPAAWVGLTDEELTDLFYNTNLGQQSAVAQAIALLKERNT